ncbi:MAG: HNH endonuclease [Bacteroidales bacterium]|nr:HNH endonuclease [Bacteroidales bacterium]
MEKREKSQRERLLEETAGVCVYCGHPLTVETMETDHIVPKSKGGTGEFLNKVCACGSCNARKADLDIRGFLAGFSGRRRRRYENRLDALVEQGRMSAEKRALLSDFREEEPFPEEPVISLRGTVLFCVQLC